MNNSVYIPPKRAMDKLKYAHAVLDTVYISAATGFGKTQLYRNYFKSRRYICFSCAEDGWSADSVEEEIRGFRRNSRTADIPVVVDDLQDLYDEELRNYIISLAGREEIWLVLAGRGSSPKWLAPLYISGTLIWIQEEDLRLDAGAAAKLSSQMADGFAADKTTAEVIVRLTEGMPLMVRFLLKNDEYIKNIEGTKPELTEKFREQAGRYFRDYLNTDVIPQLDISVVNFCMQVSVVDAFNRELAEYITGSQNAEKMVDYLQDHSSWMAEADEGSYRFRAPVLRALRERRDRTFDSGKLRDLYYNAGLYYESHGRILEAAYMYEQAGSSRLDNILIENARRNPADGYYYELRSYYRALTEEEIRQDIFLMSGMSMFYALMLEPEKSEYWYQQLEKCADHASRSVKAQIRIQLLFLDISLPQRGTEKIDTIFQQLPRVFLRHGYELPEFSVTSNLPSMMNGGKDFSEWSRRGRVLAASIGKIVEGALGKYGRGLVPLALAESQFEKGGDLTEIVSWVSKGQMQAQNGGKIQMEFVAAALLARICQISGRLSDAESYLLTFREKAVREHAEKLLPNIDAVCCRMRQYAGDILAVEEWMKQAPDDTNEFYCMNRLLYLTKIRSYIILGMYHKAFVLGEKVLDYAVRYKRTLVSIEANLLLAVILFRRKNEAWKERLAQGLAQAADYQFIDVVRSEGAALLPLLQEICREEDMGGLRGKVPEDWLAQILQEVKKQAELYPNYLQEETARLTEFSQKGINILRLQAKGYSVPQIAAALDMKPETVRYHIKQNYKKLQVSSKGEAILAARTIGLI